MKKLWFRRKLYGWGWTPTTWQGWLVIGIYIIALIKISDFVEVNSLSQNDALKNVSIPVIIITSLLIIICYSKGEKPRWQWGKDLGDK